MLTAVDPGDQIAVVAVIVGIATGLIAVAALVVAWKARGDARRSADAAEESARQARRSADAEERAVALSQHEAEQRAANRHKDDGPGSYAWPATSWTEPLTPSCASSLAPD